MILIFMGQTETTCLEIEKSNAETVLFACFLRRKRRKRKLYTELANEAIYFAENHRGLWFTEVDRKVPLRSTTGKRKGEKAR